MGEIPYIYGRLVRSLLFMGSMHAYSSRFHRLFRLAALVTGCISHGCLAFAGATEAEFYEAKKIFSEAYAEELAANEITIKADFKKNLLQAEYFSAPGKTILLYTDGAAAKPVFSPLLDRDAYILIYCHEMGHAIGGLYISSVAQTSVEGMADYYATATCLPRVFNDDGENAKFAKEHPVDHELRQWCETRVKDVHKQNLCLRIGTAALAVTASNVLSAKKTIVAFPKINTPDCSQHVLIHSFGPTIKSRHPSVQCRLDTYMRAIVGEAPPPCWLSRESPENGKFFENMDRIYGQPNICQKTCQGLPAGVEDLEREQRCLSAPCTRMMFGFLSPGKNYDTVDNTYHREVLARVRTILSADERLRNDCALVPPDVVSLEMLLGNTDATKLLCPPPSKEIAGWKGPYVDASVVQPILDGGKTWCTPPKLGVDCTESLFERALKNCAK